MEKKMTKKEMFGRLIEIVEGANIEDTDAVVEFLNHEIELVSKKRNGQTKTQKENEKLVEVVFEGSAPNGTVYINNNNDMDPVEYWSLSADKTEGLNNGDKIVVTFDVDDSDIEECVDETGKIPDALSKEYEVSGLSAYVTSSAQISNEALESMKTRAKSNAENDIPYEAENPRYDYAGYYQNVSEIQKLYI